MKKFTLLLFLFLPFLSQAQSMDDKIKTLSNDIADQILKSGAKKVAVAAFEYKGCNNEFGKFLAEEMTGYLSISGRSLTVVNQRMLETLLAQNQLTAKGLIEAKNEAAKLGQVSGIDAIVYGTITTIGEELRISANIIRLPALTVFGFGKTGFPLTSSIKEMLPCAENAGTETAGNTVASAKPKTNTTIPSPRKDCEAKNTCVICVTNGSGIPVKATIPWPGIPSLFVQPNATKCLDNVAVKPDADHMNIFISYTSETGAYLKEDHFIIEPCKVYERTFNK